MGQSEGAPDWEVAAVAVERDYIIVTNNRRDFLRLYAQLDASITA
jgi:predicted nucleic acid-binding protein